MGSRFFVSTNRKENLGQNKVVPGRVTRVQSQGDLGGGEASLWVAEA